MAIKKKVEIPIPELPINKFRGIIQDFWGGDVESFMADVRMLRPMLNEENASRWSGKPSTKTPVPRLGIGEISSAASISLSGINRYVERVQKNWLKDWEEKIYDLVARKKASVPRTNMPPAWS